MKSYLQSTWFSPNHGRMLARGISLLTAFLLMTNVAIAQNIVDLTTSSSTASYNGANFDQGDGGTSAGSGIFDPFYQIHSNDGLVSGVNTGGRPTQFETKANGVGAATDLLLSTVTQVDISGTLYREFFLDINQTAGNAIYDILDIQMYADSEASLNELDPATHTFGDDTGPAANLIFWLDGAPQGDGSLRLNYSLEAGSGKADMRMLIPDASFGAGPECDYGQVGCEIYIYLYSQFFENDDGFEEWSTSIQPFVQISKTAVAALEENTDWTITKEVTPTSWDLLAGDSGTSDYTVELDKTVTQSNISVTGQITLVVPETLPDGDENAAIAEVQSLTDVFEGLAANSITCLKGGVPFILPGDINPGETVVCDYVFDLNAELTGTNTATASVLDRVGNPRPFITTAAVGPYVVTPTGEPGTINVTDDYATASTGDDLTFGPFSNDETIEYSRTFTCDTDEGTFENTASIDETDDSDDASVTVNCWHATVAKTTATDKVRTYTWTVDKSVTPETWDLFTGDTGTSDYTVDVTRTADDGSFMVMGTITVSVEAGSPIDVKLTDVSDLMTPGNIAGVVVCTDPFPQTISDGSPLECSYSATLPDETTLSNVATATYENTDYASDGTPTPNGTTDVDSDAIDVVFDANTEITEIDETATVTDDWGTADAADDVQWGFSGDGQQTYSRTFTCDDDQGSLKNTVEIVGDDTSTSFGTSDATVTVSCHNIAVSKDAETVYTREHDWDIDKTAFMLNGSDPIASLILMPGDVFAVEYKISVNTTGFTDSGWAVSGEIEVSNPAPIDAVINSLSDLITSGDINVTPDCGTVVFPYTIPAGGSLTCSYTKDLPDATDRTNTATATQQNFAYASDGTSSNNGTTDYSGAADVDFGDPTTVLDACTDVTDANAPDPNLGQACIDDVLPKVFSYAFDVAPTTEDCDGLEIKNTAVQTEEDTTENSDAIWTITVDVVCQDGCTLTQGYWKTHNDSFHGGASKKADPTWDLIGDRDGNTFEESELEEFYLSLDTWFGVLWTPPEGNPYYTMAHQWIAATLNVLNGASDASISDELAEGLALLEACAPGDTTYKGNGTCKARDFRKLNGKLAEYNEGLAGVPHCSENPDEFNAPVASASESPDKTTDDETASADSNPEDVNENPPASDDPLRAENLEEIETVVNPTEFGIINYPNPFSDRTTLQIDVPERAEVHLAIYDVLGRKVALLVDGWLSEGSHSVRWSGSDQPNGVYFAVMRAGDFRQTRRMSLLH